MALLGESGVADSSAEQQGWLEITVQTHKIAHEAVSAFFFDLGCAGVVSEEFKDRSLRAYLPFPENLEKVRTRVTDFLCKLQEIFPDLPPPNSFFNRIDAQDWGLSWRRFFHPERVSPGLMIFPEWEPVPESVDGHVIKIDPGPAFGTGQHPTTGMCLEAMEGFCFSGPWSMLDVGTGSGILAIYGAKLGAGIIEAIDIDPDAIRWAKRNIRLNGLEKVIKVSSRPLEHIDTSFSLLAANLIMSDILKLLPLFPGLMAPEGGLILSGILRSQAPEVERAVAEVGLYVSQTLYREEWACMITRKSA